MTYYRAMSNIIFENTDDTGRLYLPPYRPHSRMFF